MKSQIAVEINEERCSICSTCSSLCPFEAIKKDPETGKLALEVEKCQVCGICYSACPAKAISILYYDLDSLVSYLERAKKRYDSNTLVVMCKGSAPAPEEIKRMYHISNFIPLLLPCVGRVPVELYLKAITTGIEKIYCVACEQNFCRFEKGSAIAGRTILALDILLGQLGYGEEAITLKRNSLKVVPDRYRCIGCGNCVFFCPYDAVTMESPGVAKFDLNLCRGCGLCVALCPAMALEHDGWEHKNISSLISRLSSEMTSPKTLVFRCQWAFFPQLDEELPTNVRFIDLPCTGRIDPLHILQALSQGIDGVLIAACPEEDCKMKEGSKGAERSITALKKALGQIGLEQRLHFCHVAPRYPETFARELQEFKERIEKL